MPPPEIANQGSDVAMQFVRDAVMHGRTDNRCVLFTLGEYQGGKTSVLNAIMTADARHSEGAGPSAVSNHGAGNPAEKGGGTGSESCYRPRSTIGFERSSWAPSLPAREGLRFDVFDLGGHVVSRRFHQHLMISRAVYLLVWRARALDSSEDPASILAETEATVCSYLDDLRFVAPGATVMLVVSHVDCVSSDELSRQRATLQAALKAYLSRFAGHDE